MSVPERRQLDCERTRALASLALDSDLSEVERLHVVAHVEQCGECSRIIGTMERLTGEVRAAATLTPPRMPRIMVAPRRRSLPVARLAAFAGAVLVAGLAGA